MRRHLNLGNLLHLLLMAKKAIPVKVFSATDDLEGDIFWLLLVLLTTHPSSSTENLTSFRNASNNIPLFHAGKTNSDDFFKCEKRQRQRTITIFVTLRCAIVHCALPKCAGSKPLHCFRRGGEDKFLRSLQILKEA